MQVSATLLPKDTEGDGPEMTAPRPLYNPKKLSFCTIITPVLMNPLPFV